MESSGRLLEAVTGSQAIGAQTIGTDELWSVLEQRLQALAAMEYAHQRRSLSLDRGSEMLVLTFALKLASNLARRLRQTTEQLPKTEQPAARSAISKLFGLRYPPRDPPGR